MALPKKTLLSFFGKSTTPSTPAASTTSSNIVAAAPLVAPQTIPTVNVIAPQSALSSTAIQSHSSTAPLPEHPILQELRRTLESLPDTIPLGLPEDSLATLSYSTKEFIFDDQDAWEDIVNPMLDHVLGFGIAPDAIRTLIHCGQYGMDGVYCYFSCCICDLGIDPGLLEGKLEWLLTAMVELYISFLLICTYINISILEVQGEMFPSSKQPTPT